MELTNNNINDSDALGNIDLGKIWRIIRKSILWIVLIMLFTNTLSILYLRYTKPVYESNSILKLELESDASVLGFSNPELNGNIKGLSGEIELLKSKLFFRRVANTINYDVSYNRYGRYLTDEKYKNSPFKVFYEFNDEFFYDRKIDVEILDDDKFQIELPSTSGLEVSTHRFNETIEINGNQLMLAKTKFFSKENGLGKYYFVINSTEKVINFLKNSVSVVPENVNAHTVRISLRDFNQLKAQDFVNAIDTLYLSYIKETKN
ncbi:MAG: Wzz/FepE/Etk N-terminal domain-containing protein, partial [Cyclobacteriaceae bacterium]